MRNENEVNFIKSIVALESNVRKVQKTIDENFGAKSAFDLESMTLTITNEGKDKLALAQAKAAAAELLAESNVAVTFGIITEAAENKVFVVYDDQKQIVGVYSTKEDAEASASINGKQLGVKCTVSEEDKSTIEK